MAAEHEGVVRDFCAAWRRKSIDELLTFFTADAVYHNIPLEPLRGIDAIRETLGVFVTPSRRPAMWCSRSVSTTLG
jgi:limonene-1,2-epoxide hydrolase